MRNTNSPGPIDIGWYQWGWATDLPVVGDWIVGGSTRDTPGVVRA